MACMVVERVFISSTRQQRQTYLCKPRPTWFYLADIRPARYIKTLSQSNSNSKSLCERETVLMAKVLLTSLGESELQWQTLHEATFVQCFSLAGGWKEEKPLVPRGRRRGIVGTRFPELVHASSVFCVC